MTQEISALMDGELDTADVDGIIKACRDNEQHRDAWRCYHLIGDSLRQEHGHRPGLEQRILGQLHSEPTVLAPRRRVAALPRIALAAAASLATISAVAWLAMQQSPTPPKAVTLSQAPVVQPVAVSHVEDYLRAHREFSAAPDALMPASFSPGAADGSTR